MHRAPFVAAATQSKKKKKADLRKGHTCDSSLEADIIRTGLPPSFVPHRLVSD